MPVRQLPVTDLAVRVLLDSIVDYAGLYPPSALGMAEAVRGYAHYRAGGSGWMLGRFVCPATSLELFSREADLYLPRDPGAIGWPLSVTGSGKLQEDIDAMLAFNELHRICFDEFGAHVDAYEVKAASVSEIKAIHEAAPAALQVFIEVPVHTDPTRLLEAIAATGRRAKIRTGGVTPDAFPDSEQIARFLEACHATGVTAKATAGLHHPLRGEHHLTYAADAPSAMMYGYINMFLAASLVASGAPHADVVALLDERDPASITFDDTHCHWKSGTRSHALERGFIKRTRDRMLTSFGSCSFTEPVNETRALGWI